MAADTATAARRTAVIGGGIGGLTAALALERHGLVCNIFEQAPELREIGAGVALWPPALAVFDHLGIGEAVRALGGQWRVAGLRRADGSFLVRYTADELARVLGEPTIAVHRGELQSLLLASLSRSRVCTGFRLEAIDVHRECPVELRFANGSTTTADLVIAADGFRSTVRERLSRSSAVRDCRYRSLRGTARQPAGTDWHELAGETWGPRGRFGLIPIGNSRITWYAAVNGFGSGDLDELRARFGGWHYPIPELIEATAAADIWCDRIYDRRPLLRWTVGRVALLGDAAHPMTPELGQGACQAILDASSLAQRISTEPSIARALRAYGRDRKPRAWMTTMVARAVAATGRADGPLARTARERAMTLLPQPLFLRQLRMVSGAQPSRQ